MPEGFREGSLPVPPQEKRSSFIESVRFVEGELTSEQIERTKSELLRISQDPQSFIDKGGAGSVHRLNGRVCLKVMEARRHSPRKHLMDLGNPVIVEAQFLAEASRLEVNGARTCYCYGFYSSDRFEDPDFLLMEELDAVNLQHVLNGTVPPPDSFDSDAFLDDYAAFINALHEAGIAHGDIAPRNVMIDRETGKPRIIDFGRSLHMPLSRDKRQELIDKDFEDFNLVFDEVERKFNLE